MQGAIRVFLGLVLPVVSALVQVLVAGPQKERIGGYQLLLHSVNCRQLAAPPDLFCRYGRDAAQNGNCQ